jgi:hypothetical protein
MRSGGGFGYLNFMPKMRIGVLRVDNEIAKLQEIVEQILSRVPMTGLALSIECTKRCISSPD